MPPGREAARPGATSQRQHILDTALSLMAQRGVDGTSMRDLANAAGLNVASLYHYFPSKRDLLVAVLDERGFLDDLAAPRPPALVRRSGDELAGMLNDMLASMLEVEDFIRLMLGEVMRGDDTAHGVGVELFERDPRVARALADRDRARAVRALRCPRGGPDAPGHGRRALLRARRRGA